MLRQRYVGLLACAALPLLGGCVQATRHSNTMVFGTNTTVGVKVGRDVNQMPNVLIAYDRQEAVIMPLLANTGEKPGSQNMLTPCAPATEITTTGGKPPTTTTQKMNDEISFGTDGKATVHPCKFVGVRTGPDNFLIQDSYSVLASFGAKLHGDGTGGTGAAGLAQYFATGAAAQTLALNGGAAIIAVGDAAKAASSNPSNAAAAAAALGSPIDLKLTAAQRETIVKTNDEYDAFRKDMVTVFSRTPAAMWSARLADFTSKSGVVLTCTDSAECVRLFETGTPLFADFYNTETRAKLATQKTAWQTANGG